ncbi:MAG TPA: hypothetical protein VMF90_14805 [Rhizobiaceae bacterium]|nr:hypothetical protein [Rhizobiaceae bacterium]
MYVRVITPPDPIVTPADIAGDHGPDDAGVAALIQAVTEQIDGPEGWLGRALGPQTLELAQAEFCEWVGLPCRPIITIDNVRYLDRSEDEQTLPDSDYRVIGNRLYFRGGFTAPAIMRAPDALRIRYQAGYNDEDASQVGGTGPVPERARQAIILSVQHLKSLAAQDVFLRVDEVEGVGSRQYSVTDAASRVIEQACDRMLTGLRVYS